MESECVVRLLLMYCVLNGVVPHYGFVGHLESRFEITIVHSLRMTRWFVICYMNLMYLSLLVHCSLGNQPWLE